MPYNPGLGLNLTAAGAQGALAGGRPGGPSRLQTAGEAVGTEALGAIPVVGGMLKGAVSGYRSGLGGAMTGLAPGAQQALQQQSGGQAQGVTPPKALSKGRKAARGAGIAALNLIPFAGPVLSAGAGIANSAYERNQTNKYKNQVKQTGQANQTRLGQMAGGAQAGRSRLMGSPGGVGMGGGPPGMGPQRAPIQRTGRYGAGMGLAGGGAMGGGSMEGASQAPGGAPPRPTGGVPSAPGGAGQVSAASQTRGSPPPGPAGIPSGTGIPAGAGNPNLAAARGMGGVHSQNRMAVFTNRILAEQLQRGLDPRILSGLQGSATQAAAGTRQAMSDALSRSGDQSGYNLGIQGGTEMALQNQLAAIPSQFYAQQQDYLNDLIFKTRGTRPGTSAPQNSGTNWGAVLGGIGQLGQGVGSMVQAFQPPPK